VAARQVGQLVVHVARHGHAVGGREPVHAGHVDAQQRVVDPGALHVAELRVDVDHRGQQVVPVAGAVLDRAPPVLAEDARRLAARLERVNERLSHVVRVDVDPLRHCHSTPVAMALDFVIR
jgi:hypothetical protein